MQGSLKGGGLPSITIQTFSRVRSLFQLACFSFFDLIFPPLKRGDRGISELQTIPFRAVRSLFYLTNLAALGRLTGSLGLKVKQLSA